MTEAVRKPPSAISGGANRSGGEACTAISPTTSPGPTVPIVSPALTTSAVPLLDCEQRMPDTPLRCKRLPQKGLEPGERWRRPRQARRVASRRRKESPQSGNCPSAQRRSLVRPSRPRYRFEAQAAVGKLRAWRERPSPRCDSGDRLGAPAKRPECRHDHDDGENRQEHQEIQSHGGSRGFSVRTSGARRPERQVTAGKEPPRHRPSRHVRRSARRRTIRPAQRCKPGR